MRLCVSAQERAITSMAFLKIVRAVEPYLKALSHRVTSSWKGNHIVYVSGGASLACVSSASVNPVLASLSFVSLSPAGVPRVCETGRSQFINTNCNNPTCLLAGNRTASFFNSLLHHMLQTWLYASRSLLSCHRVGRDRGRPR